jgi:ABC-type multidrug transport system, ATPase and permease components
MAQGGMGGGRGRRGGRPLTEEEKKNAPKITWPLLKRIFSYLLPYWTKLLMVFVAILFSSGLSLLPPLLMGRVVDEGLIGGDLNMLLILIGMAFGVLVISNLISVLESYLNTWVAQNITFDMRNKMFRHLLNMSHRFFYSSKQGDVITRMTSDIGSVQTVIASTLTGLFSNISVLVLAVVAMYQKNWIMATAGVIITPLFILPTKQVGNKRWDITYEAQKKSDEINQILSESLSASGQTLVKLFTQEDEEYRKYETANAEMTKLNIKESMAGRWFRAAMSTFMNAGPMIIYLVGGLLMLRFGDTKLTVGDITVMVALLERMYRPVNVLLNMQVDIIRSMAIFTRIFEYYDMPVEIKNKEGAVVPDSITGELEYRDVNFHYSEGQPILRNLSFTVKPGRSVAIVGPSGAGKSTTINLIPRLYDVIGGQILLDGRDLRELNLKWLRDHIGLVTQDTYLFNGTIRANLLYAAPGATSEDMERACKEANIHDFIMSLPAGYDTEVGNRGLKLSGGERQRISIARVILKNPKLIILDEATSSLDSISESHIQDAIEPLLRGRTSLVIAHRLSTIMAADEILVLENGELVERGDHAELIELDGVYKELYETQFRYAIDASRQTASE